MVDFLTFATGRWATPEWGSPGCGLSGEGDSMNEADRGCGCSSLRNSWKHFITLPGETSTRCSCTSTTDRNHFDQTSCQIFFLLRTREKKKSDS